MEKERPYERITNRNINGNAQYLKKLEKINETKNWVFGNYNNPNNNTINMNNPSFIRYNQNQISEKEVSSNNYLSSILNLRDKEIQREKEKEKYRKDLLKQIEENERRRKNKKREIDQENKINEIKYREYLLYKQKQEEEYERIKKLNNNKKLKSQFILENQNISFNNKIESQEQNKENSKINNEEEIKKEIKRNRRKNMISYGYNRILRNNRNMFDEKEEFKNYIDNEFQDYNDILEDNIDIMKNQNQNNLYKNEDLRLSYDFNANRKKKKKVYIIYNNLLHRNVDKRYAFAYDKISEANELTKSYKMEMKPSMYFNHKIDVLLDSYSNLILFNNNKENKDNNYIKEKINNLNNDIKKYKKDEEFAFKNKDNDIKKNNIEEKRAQNEIRPKLDFIQTNNIEKMKENENNVNSQDKEQDLVINIIDKSNKGENKEEYKEEIKEEYKEENKEENKDNKLNEKNEEEYEEEFEEEDDIEIKEK